MPRRIGVVADGDYLIHRIPDPVHESPRRLVSLYHRLNETEVASSLIKIPPRAATEEELLRVHSELYLEQIRHYAVAGDPYAYDKDTYLMEDSFYVASLAAGGCLGLVDEVVAGRIDNGFALIRPPGHHATSGNGAGFCIFNNIAVTAQYILDHHKIDRILILDIDAHHGNGTQEIFWTDDRVLFASIHQRQLFPPETGQATEIGEDAGVGYTVNVPVFPSFGDEEFTFIVERVVQELVLQFAPQIILVSAGFDGHRDEPISDLQLTTQWYADLVARLTSYARQNGSDKMMFVLEGGYHPASLESSVLAVLNAMADEKAVELSNPFSQRANELLNNEVFPQLAHKWQLGMG